MDEAARQRRAQRHREWKEQEDLKNKRKSLISSLITEKRLDEKDAEFVVDGMMLSTANIIMDYSTPQSQPHFLTVLDKQFRVDIVALHLAWENEVFIHGFVDSWPISLNEMARLDRLWSLLNPFKEVEVYTVPTDFKVMDEASQARYRPLQPKESSPLAFDILHGAFTIALPATFANEILRMMVESDIRQHGILVAEVTTLERTSPAQRFYAYCCNPDLHAPEGLVALSPALIKALDVLPNQTVRIRLVHLPTPPPREKVGLKLGLTEVIKDVDDQVLQRSLTECLQHHRVLCSNQELIVRLPDLKSITYRVLDVFGNKGTPVAAFSMHTSAQTLELGIKTEVMGMAAETSKSHFPKLSLPPLTSEDLLSSVK